LVLRGARSRVTTGVVTRFKKIASDGSEKCQRRTRASLCNSEMENRFAVKKITAIFDVCFFSLPPCGVRKR